METDVLDPHRAGLDQFLRMDTDLDEIRPRRLRRARHDQAGCQGLGRRCNGFWQIDRNQHALAIEQLTESCAQRGSLIFRAMRNRDRD